MNRIIFYCTISILLLLTSCEKDFAINVKNSEPQLIVEAYINNLYPEYNYVVLSQSQNYFAPNFQSIAVSNAIVKITEGTIQNGQILWNNAGAKTFAEINNPLLPTNLSRGFYADPQLFVNPANAILATPNKYYRLDIAVNGNNYTGTTYVPNIITLDSLKSGFPFVDEDTISKVRLTSFYKDPDTLGNTQFYYWRKNENKNNFGWAGLHKSRAPGRDDEANGTYITITHPQGFLVNDTVTYMLTSVDKNTHNFWSNIQIARDNSGSAFSTPVTVKSYINGPNVIGCFSGFAISAKTIIMH